MPVSSEDSYTVNIYTEDSYTVDSPTVSFNRSVLEATIIATANVFPEYRVNAGSCAPAGVRDGAVFRSGKR